MIQWSQDGQEVAGVECTMHKVLALGHKEPCEDNKHGLDIGNQRKHEVDLKHLFKERAMEKSIKDVQLANWPIKVHYKS